MSHLVLRVPEPEHPPDHSNGPYSTGLVGRTFDYVYPTGLKYKISFDEENVYFSVPPEAPTTNGQGVVGVPVRVRELRPNQYLAHWMVPGRKGHVAVIFDLDAERVDAAALMPGSFELFDRANFNASWENGEAALWKQ